MSLRRFGQIVLALACAAFLVQPTSAFSEPIQSPKSEQPAPDAKLPMSGLLPSKLFPGICVVKYRVTTNSPECQAFFDQGLGYFYSYVWLEAVRSFETACRHDPDCAMAWLGLAKSLERYHRSGIEAMKKAQATMPKASHREQLLIQARLEEKGMWPNVGNADARLKAALKTVDTLLSLYDDDEEGWYYRAQLTGGSGLFGGQISSAPFYKAMLRINPLHPGANHELVHFYENIKRPALGWQYAEKYIESTPGIPHSFHMQAHLATRIGRWDKTTDWSMKAIELERAYHKDMKVKPSDDQQYRHHLEIFMRCLIHDGRFAEARQLKKECQADNIKHPQVWFQLHLAERDYDAALKLANDERKRDGASANYMTALVHLRKKDIEAAATEVAALVEAQKKRPSDKQLQLRLWEALGILKCHQDEVDEGLALLNKAVEKTKGEYSHHAWGNGAYHMLAWGHAALACQKYDVAEEAYLEALAHDAGCFHGALGLQVLCEKLGRTEEAARYAELAKRFWRKASPADVARELDLLRAEVASARATHSTSLPNSVLERQSAKLRFAIVGTDRERLALRGLETEFRGSSFPNRVWERVRNPQSAIRNPQSQDLKSGVPVGSRPGPYSSIVITGQHRGTPHCFICETGDRPAVIIFARNPTDALGKLANAIDQAMRGNAELRSWITFLYEDQTKVDAKLVQWAKDHALGNVPLAVFEDLGGPPSYKLSKDADVTVHISENQKVIANFAFRAEELTDQRIESVLKALPAVLKNAR